VGERPHRLLRGVGQAGHRAVDRVRGPPVGRGLLSFVGLQEAVDALDMVEKDYVAHATAARRLAEEHFGSDLVLGSMLDVVGL